MSGKPADLRQGISQLDLVRFLMQDSIFPRNCRGT
jgi:hypothetical protein